LDLVIGLSGKGGEDGATSNKLIFDVFGTVSFLTQNVGLEMVGGHEHFV
jgi:hypothetical protein